MDPTEEEEDNDDDEDADFPVDRTGGADFMRDWGLARWGWGFHAGGAVCGRFEVDRVVDATDDGRTLTVRTELGGARYVNTDGWYFAV